MTSNIVTTVENINRFLDSESVKYPDIAEQYNQCNDLFTNKHWHQLTTFLLQFVFDEQCFKNENMLDLFYNFITHFSKHLNAITLARILVRISKQYKDLTVAMDFLNSIIISQFNGQKTNIISKTKTKTKTKTTVVAAADTNAINVHSAAMNGDGDDDDDDENEPKNATEKQARLSNKIAILIIQCEVAHLHLIGNHVKKSQVLIEKITHEMAKYTVFYALCQELYLQYYRVLLQYHKIVGNPEKFLHFSLLFLEHTNCFELSFLERSILSSDICLAALLSDKCYNFSKLIQHPLIEHLNGHSDYDWLFQMMNIFNFGNLTKWNSFLNRERTSILKNAALSTNISFLEQKIRLMALIELIFNGYGGYGDGNTIAHNNRGNANANANANGNENEHNRNGVLVHMNPQLKNILTFHEICQYCDITMDECELVLMRAFSLNIIKGVIDQIDQTVQISYIIPRNLSIIQVKQLNTRMNSWIHKIQDCQQNIGLWAAAQQQSSKPAALPIV